MSFSSYEKERLLFEKWRLHNEELVCTPCLQQLIREETNPDIIKLYKEEIEKNISLTPCNHNKQLKEFKLIDNEGVLNRTGRRRRPIKFIVIHWTVTRSWEKTVRVLNRRGGGISTHFEIDREGNVHEYADPATTVTYHAGSPWNAYSIGIDITSLGFKKAKRHKCRERGVSCKRNVERSARDLSLTGFTGVQEVTARQFVTTLCNKYDIPQVVAPDYRQFRPKTVNQIVQHGIGIVRHRNLKKTACPGWFPIETLGTPFSGEINIERVQGTHRPTTAEQKAAAVKTGTLVAFGGGHFLTGFKEKVEQNFDFKTFYDDLATFGKGIQEELPTHKNDFTFGDEHLAAWQRLQKNPEYLKMKKGIKPAAEPATPVVPEEVPETPVVVKENTFSSFKKEKLLFENWRNHIEG